MQRPTIAFLTAAALAAALTPAAASAAGRVAVIATLPTYDADVVTKLSGTGRFTGVDYIDASTTTPTLATLQNYSSVLVYSDTTFANNIALGNSLDTYLRGGGGVVVGVFGYNVTPLGGAFANDYALSPSLTQMSGERRTLGTVLLPNDPLMAGVTGFDGGDSSYYSNVTLVPGATAVANYDNGVTLVAKRTIAGVQTVNLNFYAPSNAARNDFWVTGGTTLMANALQNVGVMGPAVPEPATWAMMVLGFGVVGSTIRRRKPASASAQMV